MNTKDIGEKSEGMVLAALLKADKTVLLPFGDNQRYDIVLDEGSSFRRVQCKTGRLKHGAIEFNTCSVHCRTAERKDYRGEADLFGVYCPELDKVFLIPVGDVPKRMGVLRVEPPKNNQRKGIRFAANYEVG